MEQTEAWTSNYIQKKPGIYQTIKDKKVSVKGRFAMDAEKNTYGFKVGAHDKRHALVIESKPHLYVSTLIEGSSNDSTLSMAKNVRNFIVEGGHWNLLKGCLRRQSK
jgi:hypothetical protein